MQLNEYDYKALARCPLFQGIEIPELMTVMKNLPYKILEHETGSFLVLRGEACKDLYILLEGLTAAEISDFNGKVLKVESLHAPQALASGVLFSENNVYPVQVRAESRTRSLILPRQSVFLLLQNNQVFLSNYLLDMGSKITFLADKISLLQFKSLRQKIAGYLLDLRAKQNRLDIRIPYTMESLAEIFSVARPSLSRAFSQMIEEGLFTREESKIRILEPELLKKELEQNAP